MYHSLKVSIIFVWKCSQAELICEWLGIVFFFPDQMATYLTRRIFLTDNMVRGGQGEEKKKSMSHTEECL